MNQTALCVAATLAIFSVSQEGFAASYPTKPIRFVQGFAPGGASDIVSRIVAQRMSDSIGQPIVIDNRPAATGSAAAVMVARSTPDGYTMLCAATSTMAVNPSLYKNVPYDALRDFTPVSQMVAMPTLLVVNPAVSAKSVSDLIALAKAENGRLSFASAGLASANHMAAELFSTVTKVKMTHIPYKGGAPALIDVLGGQVQVMFATMVSVVPYVRSGKLRPLGISSAQRLSSMPEVPTIAEAGVPGYESTIWYGIVLPAGVPQPVVNTLSAETLKVLNNPEIKKRFTELGAEATPKTPQQFAEYLRTEIIKWSSVVKNAGIKGE